MKTTPLILVSAISMILAISVSLTMAQQINVNVTDPSRNGVEVRRTYKVTGTASIPSGTHLWVLTRREDFEGLWWPQNQGKIDPVSKKWKVSVTFGIPDDIGWDFDLAVIVVADSQHAILRDYRINAMKTGDWHPMEMPEVSTAPILLRVKKIGH